MPLSGAELSRVHLLPATYEHLFLKGCYPGIYAHAIQDTQLWFSNYIGTYVERDVRQVLNISDTITFQRFLKLCAARIGNVVNYADLARNCDMSAVTAKAWLSVLETSFIVKLVQPFYRNYSKRVIVTPKLYFYDTAIVCGLLGIKTADDLSIHPLRGALFESFVMSEMFKYCYNAGQLPQLYFWRDVQGHEIDCVVEKSLDNVVPIEIKAGMTVRDDFFKGLVDWKKITGQEDVASYVVYGGDDNLDRKQGRVFSWRNLAAMLDVIYER